MSNLKPIINCVKNGPARIEGEFILQLPNGETREINGKISLCRCGISEKMPFCDGNHKNCTPRHDELK